MIIHDYPRQRPKTGHKVISLEGKELWNEEIPEGMHVRLVGHILYRGPIMDPQGVFEYEEIEDPKSQENSV